ncbi:hypothetical protein [Aquisphaera insulae]|uniref:hypothetical protein n=1 Tax=Aquisphaera insulae TaxID=2712864 RepID=UPI0013ECFF79|nr:hypothetical protein [Aquisphaera insulae]
MTHPSLHPLARPRLAALAALLTAWLLAPGEARAGCSARHAADGPAAQGRRPGRLDVLAAAGGLAIADDSAPTPAPRPAPCSGAFCSGSPAAPDSANPAAPPGGEGWAATSERLTPTPPAPLDRRGEGPRAAPVDRGPSIFHPPRPA